MVGVQVDHDNLQGLLEAVRRSGLLLDFQQREGPSSSQATELERLLRPGSREVGWVHCGQRQNQLHQDLPASLVGLAVKTKAACLHREPDGRQ